MVEESSTALLRETALQREWFRRLTISGAVTAAGFTALLAGLGVLLHVKVLLLGAAIVGGVFLVTLLALILARRGRLLLPAQLLAGAGVAHAVVQSYLFPFAASVLAVSAVLSIASVLPYVHGRPLRGLVIWSILSSLAIAALPSVSPLADVVPHAAQQVIEIAGLPAVTILTALLLLQYSERIRRAREDETAAHVEAEQTGLALERTSQRLRIALSAAGIGIWDLDPQSGMLSLDHRCASIFGLPAGGPLDYAGFLSLIVADDQPRVGAHHPPRGAWRRRGQARARIPHSRYERRGGALAPMHRPAARRWHAGRRLDRDGPDLTSAKRTEAELRSAKERAEDANHAKDEFLAMLGHELRNPLAPMLTALELLRVRLGEAGARERDVIQRQVRNLAQLVDDVLDVAHIRKGRMTIDTNSIYARQIVSKGLELVTPMLEERRHRLEVDIQPPSLVVVGDERRLIQAVTNLLTNAVKYTDPGGAIHVSVANEGADTVLRVADTGVGISAALLPRVFDLFVQGERTPDRREGGLGLGLPIVRSIVERHGGTVSAFSDGVGRGTEFVIRLPSADAHTPMPVASAVVASDRVAASTPKVLIVDDNRDAADSLHALLRDHGFACASALDGPSGLETVAAFEPDVVLLDIGLPGLDGYEVARRIRALPQGEKYLIVAVTGYGEERDRERSAQAGFDAHLVKPVDFDQLLAIIHAMSRAAEPAAAGSAEADTPTPADVRAPRALSSGQ